ncbi:MAG: alpha/beta hydrolase [Methylobacter sp.]|uniref:hypothetical protein n=1 Tax=Methylobacter sp. TaxID=2051955 RepID=UPI002584FA21|nr:hypothetical protein [Methylobacter sp.]MCL7423230.1 alpha/beta hydrolase [Methylobacter sp.]
MKAQIILLLLLFLSGCATFSQPATEDVNFGTRGAHKLLPYNDLQYMSCDYESEYAKDDKKSRLQKPDKDASSSFTLSQEKKDVASKHFVYALMSNNVYRDNEGKPNFILPNWAGVLRKVSDSGLAFEEYHKKNENGELIEIAIAFKGTDFGELNDWRTNFSFVEPQQYRQARDFVEEVLARDYVNESVKITATGHSLGGGIALNMSLLYPGVDAVTFNQSPRAFYDVSSPPRNHRELIYEAGEILAFVRIPWHFKLNDFNRTYFNYLDFKSWANPLINEHSMYLFSRGLLLAAIKEGNPEADVVFMANFINVSLDDAFNVKKAKNPEQDKSYCRKIFKRANDHNNSLQRTNR